LRIEPAAVDEIVKNDFAGFHGSREVE
jgi:hypothetical protein